MKALFVLLLVLILPACESAPVRVTDARDVPPKRIFQMPKTDAAASATVTIVRDSGYVGSGSTIMFKVDGVEVARFATSERLEIKLKPGTHVFSVGNVPFESETSLKDGEHAYYRITVGPIGDGRVQIQRSAAIAN